MRTRAILWAASLLLALSACRTSPPATCVEGLCFNLPVRAEVVHARNRHTIRPAGWAGWIDVQRVDSNRNSPESLDDAVENLQQRHELLGVGHVRADRRLSVAGVAAAALDVELERAGQPYRRTMYLLRRGGSWFAVDVTAPAAQADEVLRAWEPVLRNLQWGQS